MNLNIEIAKAFHDCEKNAIESIKECFHPRCNKQSINSHILQKNGILSTIAENGYVTEMQHHLYSELGVKFIKTPIKKAFAFKCFCSDHDRELFKTIEVEEIDFDDYKNLLLFTLRVIYKEKFRKLVNIEIVELLIKNYLDLFNLNTINFLKDVVLHTKIGLNDIKRSEFTIWKDLTTGSESYVFKVRDTSKKDICLSSFYNYETVTELRNYKIRYKKNKEIVADIFVNLFPYKDKSIYMIAYKKENSQQVKQYVNKFFTESEKRLERRITNLMLFRCENWVISNSFFDNKIKNYEEVFSFAVAFSMKNMNQRKFFDINIFQDNFHKKFDIFKKNSSKYL